MSLEEMLPGASGWYGFGVFFPFFPFSVENIQTFETRQGCVSDVLSIFHMSTCRKHAKHVFHACKVLVADVAVIFTRHNKTFRSVSDQHCSKCSKQCQLARTLMEGTSNSLRFVGDCFCHLLAIIASAFRQCCSPSPRRNEENGTKSKLPKRRNREVIQAPGSCGNCGSCLPCQALLQRATSTGRSS